MIRISTIATLGALTILAACGGSSGGGSGDNPAQDYSQDSARAGQIVAQNAALAKTSAASMPKTGRAEYDGVVGMAFGKTPASLKQAQMLGDLDLDANFSNGRITGEMDDFHTRKGRELNGELRLSNGKIRGSDFSANVSGQLTGGKNAPGAVKGGIDGNFLGKGASGMTGKGSANSTSGNLGIVIQGVRDRD